jgi:Arc/MetJ-type ribon-helix-helix transcriptional regulator
MTLNFSQNIENLINQKIQSGNFANAEAVMIEALTLLDRKEAYKKYIENALDESEQNFANGDFLTDDEFKNKMAQRRTDFLNSSN